MNEVIRRRRLPEVPAIGNKCIGVQKLANKQTNKRV